MIPVTATVKPPVSRRRVLLVIVARLLPFVALLVSSYLAWIALTEGTAYGCGGDDGSRFSCDEVLTSRWAKWLDLPVAPFGVVVYSALAGLSWLMGNDAPGIPSGLRALLVGLVTLAAGSGLWFVFLQFGILQHLCPYCLVVHSCGIALGILLFLIPTASHSSPTPQSPVAQSPAGTAGRAQYLPFPPATSRTQPPQPPRSSLSSFETRLAILAGLVPLALLLAGQVLFPGKTYLDLADTSLDRAADLGGLQQTPAGPPAAEPSPSPPQATPTPADSTPTPISTPTPAPSTSEAETGDAGSESGNAGSESGSADSQAGSATSETDLDQLLTPPEPTVTPKPAPPPQPATRPAVPPAAPGGGRTLSFFRNQIQVNSLMHPILGSPDAPAILVEMVDYTCPKCRELHGVLQKAKAKYGNQFAIIVFPCPLSKLCNKAMQNDVAAHREACEYAKLSLAIWKACPQNFAEYHNWLMKDKTAPSINESLGEAMRLVGNEATLQQAINDPETSQRIVEYTTLFGLMRKQNDKLGLPIQFVGDRPLAGLPDVEQELFDIWEKHLPLQLTPGA